jgi:hypothetical protein
MTMFGDVPDPDQVVEDLKELVPVVYASLEIGVAKALRTFELEGTKPEKFLFADLVRYHARRDLITVGRLRLDFVCEELANNGIQLGHRNYPRLRVRKAFRGGAPVPGSFAMEQFHAQTLPMFELPYQPNLLMLWDSLLMP